MKKKKRSQFKKRNKVYFLKKNLENLQLSRKLNHKKIGSFIVKKRKSKINYKLELLKDIKIYSVFYISLLESADLRILTFTKRLSELSQNNKYEIKIITDYNPKTR